MSFKEISEKIAFVMSGGTEGVMSPHATVFTRNDNVREHLSGKKRLGISMGFTRNFEPEEIGKIPMVKEVSKTVRKIMKDAGIKNKEDVHFVQIKCPLLTSEKIQDAQERNKEVVTDNTYDSMGFSRGASALGVALGLDEISEDKISQQDILKNWGLYSGVASTSAGVELDNVEIIVMGNTRISKSNFKINHSIMRDSIDSKAVLKSLKNVGLDFAGLPKTKEVERVVNVFAKAEPNPSGYIRERRHTMLTDSDINPTRHSRSVVNAVIASIIGDPMIYVSGGAEHQGPVGGGPIATIIETEG